ncbi:molybdopterin-binding protein [Pedobacter sp. UYP24]
MNFEEIKELANKTNRIIEIEELINGIEKLAVELLSRNQSLSIKLDISDQKEESRQDVMEHFIKSVIRPSLPKNMIIASAVQFSSADSLNLKLGDKYQMIIIEAVSRALKQEQVDLKEAMNKSTQFA